MFVKDIGEVNASTVKKVFDLVYIKKSVTIKDNEELAIIEKMINAQPNLVGKLNLLDYPKISIKDDE